MSRKFERMYAIEDKELRKALWLTGVFLGQLWRTHQPAEGPLPSTRSTWGVAPARCSKDMS